MRGFDLLLAFSLAVLSVGIIWISFVMNSNKDTIEDITSRIEVLEEMR